MKLIWDSVKLSELGESCSALCNRPIKMSFDDIASKSAKIP